VVSQDAARHAGKDARLGRGGHLAPERDGGVEPGVEGQQRVEAADEGAHALRVLSRRLGALFQSRLLRR
jgi:hypothetical protein